MTKMHVYMPRQHKPAIALLEGAHGFWGVPAEGTARVSFYPNNYLLPDQNLFTSNRISGNTWLDAHGRRWGRAYFQTGIVSEEYWWTLTKWDALHRSWIEGPRVEEQENAEGKPKPIFVTNDDDGEYTVGGTTYLGLFVVIKDENSENTAVVHWNGQTGNILNQTDMKLWYKRTTTEDLRWRTTGGPNIDYGWGNLDSLRTVAHDLQPWDQTVAPVFDVYDTPEDVPADGEGPPGYGTFWAGALAGPIWKLGGRWYGIARGYVYSNGDDPLTLDANFYAANAVWRCQVGLDPSDPDSWTQCIYVAAAYDVDSAFDEFGGADREHSASYYWLEMHNSTPYFTMPPELPIAPQVFNEAFVYTLDGGAVVPSLNWPDNTCFGGPLAQVNGELLAPIISVAEQNFQVWRFDNHPDDWTLIKTYPWTTAEGVREPDIATAYGAAGYLYAVTGRSPSYFSDFPILGDGPERAWEMITFNIEKDTIQTLGGGFPPPYGGADDFGVWPIVWSLYLAPGSEEGGGGGIGGGPVPSADCGGFSAFGSSSISPSAFATVMASYSSPLLTEHAASWYYDLCVSYNINPSFALAIWVKESQIGSVPGQVLASSHNVGNIRCVPSRELQIGCINTSCCGSFGRYATWSTGAEDMLRVLNLSIYAGKTIPQIIYIYAPPSENDSNQYVEQTCGRMALWATM